MSAESRDKKRWRTRKILIFDLLSRLSLNRCKLCGKMIRRPADLAIMGEARDVRDVESLSFLHKLCSTKRESHAYSHTKKKP